MQVPQYIDNLTVNRLRVRNLAIGGPDAVAAAGTSVVGNGVCLLPGAGGGGGYAPPTTKGVLITADGTNSVNMAPGTDGQVLVVNSAVPNGIQWAAPAAGGGYQPPTTKGVLITADGTSTVNMPPGTNGQVLVANSAVANGIQWTAASAVGYAPPTTKGVIITGNGSTSVNLTPAADGQVLMTDSTNANGVRWGTTGQTLTTGGAVAAQRVAIPPFNSNSAGAKILFTYAVTPQPAYTRTFHFDYTVLYYYEIGGVGHYHGRATVIANSTSTTGTVNIFGATQISTVDSASSGVTFASSISGNNWVINCTIPNAVNWVLGGHVDIDFVDE